MNDKNVLAHRVEGEGEPLLLLNGGMMTIASWDAIAVPFAEHYRVVRCDFRGQLLTGGSAPATVEEHATDVVALLDALGVDAAHVVGTSFGAEVGMALAALRPERVRSLVAATATPISDEFRREAAALRRACEEVAAGADPGTLYDAMLPMFYSRSYLASHADELGRRRPQMQSLPKWWFMSAAAILAAVERLDLALYLGRIVCPALVLAAGCDRIMPLECARALARDIRGARLAVVEDSGHVLVVEQPQRFIHECLSFLASVEVSS